MKKIVIILFSIYLNLFPLYGACNEFSSVYDNYDSNEMKYIISLIEDNKLSELKEYVYSGVNINTLGRDGTTLLMWAMKNDNRELVKFLLEIGSDPRVPLGKDISPLCVSPSIEGGFYLELFLRYASEPNYWCYDKNLLMISVTSGFKDNVIYLLNKGSSSSLKNKFSFDAATKAITVRQYEILALLIQNGYDGDIDKLRQSLERTYITPEYKNYNQFVKILNLVNGDIHKVEEWIKMIDMQNKN